MWERALGMVGERAKGMGMRGVGLKMTRRVFEEWSLMALKIYTVRQDSFRPS